LAGPASSSTAACRTGSVILTAKPIADRGAEGERRNPGQDDLDAADVLDLDSWPGTDTSLGHLTVRNPARGHARERCGEADIRDQTPRPQEDTAARSAHPSPRITLSDAAAEREHAHSRRYGGNRIGAANPDSASVMGILRMIDSVRVVPRWLAGVLGPRAVHANTAQPPPAQVSQMLLLALAHLFPETPEIGWRCFAPLWRWVAARPDPAHECLLSAAKRGAELGPERALRRVWAELERTGPRAVCSRL